MQTPFHAYSASAIRGRIIELQSALQGQRASICFAVKANPNQAILELMANAGIGADIVSAGELRRSLRAGIPANRIVFSGVGKSDAEITEALDAGIARFNVESLDELQCLDRIARSLKRVARASVRINPDVDALTHGKISTGKAQDKFGVSIAEARRWFQSSAAYPAVRLDGLHVHIGSQILALDPFRKALDRVTIFWRELVLSGHRIDCIDVGGGLGVAYREGERTLSASAYAQTVKTALDGFEGEIIIEPGRYLVAEAGVLLTRVIRVKPGTDRTFLVIDAAMNDLIRPSLYDAWHDIERVGAQAGTGADSLEYDIVGPICESGDTFATSRQMPVCAAGDLLLVRGTGAYGAAMASNYNSRQIAAEVLLDNGRYCIVRQRQSFEQMIAGENAAGEWKNA